MRAIGFFGAAMVFTGATYAAEGGWQEFSYPEAGFAAQYPDRPKLEIRDYKTAQIPQGVVKERVYSFNSGGVVYAVQIADFTRTRAEKDRTIDEAAKNLIGLGRVTHDVPAASTGITAARFASRTMTAPATPTRSSSSTTNCTRSKSSIRR